MEWQQRTCISAQRHTQTQTHCSMDGNYISVVVLRESAIEKRTRTHTHSDYTIISATYQTASRVFVFFDIHVLFTVQVRVKVN